MSGQSESEADACREGMVTDVLNILGEQFGSFTGDEAGAFLQFVANGQRQALTPFQSVQ